MSGWDDFLRGFDRPEGEPEQPPYDDPEIFQELDALHDERARRNDPRWFNAAVIERIARERRGRAGETR